MNKELKTAYVAGSFEQKERIKMVMQQLEEKGFRISSDWTTHQSIYPYVKNAELATQFAAEDLNGAFNCRIFILLPESEGGSTQFAELGAALFSPHVERVFVVGENNTRSVSFFHPRVERVESLEVVLDQLNDL